MFYPEEAASVSGTPDIAAAAFAASSRPGHGTVQEPVHQQYPQNPVLGPAHRQSQGIYYIYMNHTRSP